MKLIGHIISSIKKRTVLSDGYNYALAKWRYKCYYKFNYRLRFLIRKHIREQFIYRKEIMNLTCWNQGSCIHCGCQVPSLQFANKSCEGDCYPPMMSKKNWNKFKNKTNETF